MYAVVRTGSKQYKVKAGDKFRVEKLDQQPGEEVTLSDVLFVSGDSPAMGSPLVDDASVTCVVTKQAKAPKIIVFKKKRRQGYRRLNGHRQPYTELFVKEIQGPNGQKDTSNEAPKVETQA